MQPEGGNHMRTTGVFGVSWLELLIVAVLISYVGTWVGFNVDKKMLDSIDKK